MDNHSLIKVAHMFHRVRSTIVDSECWLMEPLRKYCSFYLAREGQFGNLVQRFAHSVISQASTIQALVSTFVVVYLSYEKDSLGGILDLR